MGMYFVKQEYTRLYYLNTYKLVYITNDDEGIIFCKYFSIFVIWPYISSSSDTEKCKTIQLDAL